MRIQINDNSVKLWLSENDTYNWAHKSGASWPVSELSGHRLFAEFDSNGLLDVAIDGRMGDVSADEFNAMTSDFLKYKLPKDHPAYAVSVGQFFPEDKIVENVEPKQNIISEIASIANYLDQIGLMKEADAVTDIMKKMADEEFKPEFKDSQQVFQDAIDKGVLSTNPDDTNYAGNFMYMYTTGGEDHFKHIDTRKYIKVKASSIKRLAQSDDDEEENKEMNMEQWREFNSKMMDWVKEAMKKVEDEHEMYFKDRVWRKVLERATEAGYAEDEINRWLAPSLTKIIWNSALEKK